MAREERSAGFILFRLRPGPEPAAERAEYLLLDYGRHWDFPKGHVEAGEDDLAAARRETLEEANIADVVAVPGFAEEITYFFRHKSRGLIRKTVVFFLGRTNVVDEQIALSDEHVGHAFLPYDSALRQVTYATANQVLRAAHAHLLTRSEMKDVS